MHLRRGVQQRYQDLQQYSQEDVILRANQKQVTQIQNGNNSMIIKRRSQHPDNIAALQISQAYQESNSLPRNPQSSILQQINKY